MLGFTLSVFFIVAFAVVWCEVLTANGMLFGWWDKFLHDHIRQEWILKPLGDCLYCFAGQVALWTGFFVVKPYLWFVHLLLIITVIFILHIYKQIMDKWN